MKESEIRSLFSSNIKRLRALRGLSQLGLANQAGLAHTFINDIENGKSWVSPETIARLSNALGVVPQELFRSEYQLDEEDSRIITTYINDLSDSLLRSVEDLKVKYLPPSEENKG